MKIVSQILIKSCLCSNTICTYLDLRTTGVLYIILYMTRFQLEKMRVVPYLLTLSVMYESLLRYKLSTWHKDSVVMIARLVKMLHRS